MVASEREGWTETIYGLVFLVLGTLSTSDLVGGFSIIVEVWRVFCCRCFHGFLLLEMGDHDDRFCGWLGLRDCQATFVYVEVLGVHRHSFH